MDLKVVIPCYDNPHTLRLVLEGLKRQDEGDFHVCVACDGGPAETMRSAVEDYTSSLNIDFVYVGPETKQLRVGRVRNSGAQAKPVAKRVLFLDSDCIPGPAVVSYHKQYGDSRLIACGVRYRIPEKSVPGLHLMDVPRLLELSNGQDDRYGEKPKRTAEWRANRLVELAKMERGVPMPHLCHSFQVSYPYDVFSQLSGFDERFVYREDQDLANRAVAAGCATVILPESVCYHLDHKVGGMETRHRIDLLFQEVWPEAPR